ncbi:MAG: glycoside hydrolase family 15 protein [Acidobacteriota bacterium]
MGDPSTFPDPGNRRPAGWPRLDHGMIGNGRVAALVAPSSAIEWLCLPNFDSPAVFARLLDAEHGGTFRILAREREVAGRLAYVPHTNVLSTVFEDGDAAWEIVDFAPRLPDGWGVLAPRELVRLVRPLRGQPVLRVDFDPRPDYARAAVSFVETTHGVEVAGNSTPLHLATNLPVPYVLGKRDFVLAKPVFFSLAYGRPDTVPDIAEVEHQLRLTTSGWRAWTRTCALPEFAADAVLRSALCLKLHTFHDTGAVIAAATTSIPEAMGTQRTWDYRYCWLRDAAFVLEALRRLSHNSEGEQFLGFLRDIAESGPLQPVYGIDGRRDLPEEILPHLAGFGGNGHVRIGNAAATQRQNDLVGEIVLCLETLLTDPRRVHPDVDSFLPLVHRLVEQAITDAPTRDTSIWEFRTLLAHHTFSRAMCWAAVHRGAILGRQLGAHDLVSRWEAIDLDEQRTVLERGYNRKLGFFTQALDGLYPDAANLLLPTIGLLEASDPRFVSTLRAYERLLVEDGWMLRYRNPDDFGETTSAFTICSFWWAEALALAGEVERAAELFERLLAFANPVGLFSEDVDPATGALIGNFPQAYTHVGLIHAAITIGTLLDVRSGHVRAWA